jgi:hypothetical protein
MELVCRVLCFFLSFIIIFQPTLAYAGETNRSDRRLNSGPAIWLLLAPEEISWEFGIILGPTTDSPIMGYYSSGVDKGIWSAGPSSGLFMDSSGNVVTCDYGCGPALPYPQWPVVSNPYMPYAININNEAVIRIIDLGWGEEKIFPKGQPFLTLRSETPDGTILGTAQLRAKRDGIVADIENADGKKSIISINEDPKFLADLLGDFEILGASFCIGFLGFSFSSRVNSIPPDLMDYAKLILKFTGMVLGILGLIGGFPIALGFLPTMFWYLSASMLARDIAKFVRGDEYEDSFEKAMKEALARKDQFDCANEGLKLLVIIASRKVNIEFDPSSCIAVLWESTTKLFETYAAPPR